MAIKDKAGLIALVAGVILLIGWFCPYISIWIASTHTWLWGLVIVLGVAMFGIPIPLILISGILILIFTIVILATGVMARKREDVKKMGLIWAVSGIVVFIVNFLPMAMLGPAAAYVSIGFFLTLIGSLIAVAVGILAYRG